jgi:hypothetical protein
MIAVVALIVSAFVVSQIIVTRMQLKARAAERSQDYARQDLVAARAEEVADTAATAAQLLLVRQQDADQAAAELMARTDEVARVAARADRATQSQLHQIHVLVNSELTASRTREMERTIELASSKRKIIRLHEEAGTAATMEELAEVETMEAKIDDLRAILADRLVQQRIVEADQKRDLTDATGDAE